MVRKQASRRFVADNRAVSAVIGFILVFAILMLVLTVYQAQIVPQQNAQTEFEHFEDSQNELIELRNSISTAGQADVSQFPSLTLGTTYQTRLLTINPAPPAGALQTSDSYPITIENESDSITIPTRFLEYQPGYNEIRVGSTQYEHSVLYLDERDRENNVSIIQEQNLLQDGTVRITALQNQFQQTGTNRVTLELYPQDEVDADEFPDGDDLTVTIPTQLDEDEYWDDALEDAGSIYEGVDIGEHGDGIHALTLRVDDNDLEVNTVGIQLEPDGDPAKNTDPQGRSGANGDDDTNEPTLNAEAESPISEDDESEITVSVVDADDDPVQNEDITIDVNDPGEDAFIRALNDTDEAIEIVNVGTDAGDDPLVVTTDEDGNFWRVIVDGEERQETVEQVDYAVDGSSENAGDTVELELQADDQIEVTENPLIEIKEPDASVLSNLDIAGGGDDATVFAGDDEDISVDIETVGNEDGDFDVTLEITPTDETETAIQETEEDFTVGASGTESLTFESVTEDLDADDYDVEVSTEDDDISGDLSVESAQEAAAFETLEAEEDSGTGGGRQVTFDWDITNDFDEVTIEVYDSLDDEHPIDENTSNKRNHEITLADGDEWDGGNVELRAVVSGPAGGEECEYTDNFGNNDEVEKNDFDCNLR